MLNTMLTVVAKITTKNPATSFSGIPMATADLGSDSDIEPSNDIKLAGSASEC